LIKNTDPLNLLVQFSGRPVKATLKIYTTSFRCISQETWDTEITFPSCVLTMDAYKLSNLANGTYYCILRAENAAGKAASGKIQLLLILR
jgi:hypothetical protein